MLEILTYKEKNNHERLAEDAVKPHCWWESHQ